MQYEFSKEESDDAVTELKQFPKSTDMVMSREVIPKVLVQKTNFAMHELEMDFNLDATSTTPSDTEADYLMYDPPKPVTAEFLKELLLSKKTTAVWKPCLFSVCGLPVCGKTKVVGQLLANIKPLHEEEVCTGKQGIAGHELVAVDIRQFKGLHFSHSPGYKTYRYALLSALGHFFVRHGKTLRDATFPCSDVNFFDDKLLNKHFCRVLQQLLQDRFVAKLEDEPESDFRNPNYWRKFLPESLTVLNLWDLNLDKGALHFVSALTGHLDRHCAWLFFDLDRDGDHMHEAPEMPTDTRKENAVLMNWRSRLHYLLRAAYLAYGPNSRESCTIFALHSGKLTNEEVKKRLSSLEEEIISASTHMGLHETIGHKVKPINTTDRNQWKVLKECATSKLNKKPVCTFPISYVFLRSTFIYNPHVIFVKKSELQVVANECGMNPKDLDDFCTKFMSFGSIIDVSKMGDQQSDYVIMQPIKFLHRLRDLFYPINDIDKMVNKYGLVLTKTAQEIFGEDHNVYMSALVAVGLAAKLSTNQVAMDGFKDLRGTCYFMPTLRRALPKTNCDPLSLHMQMGLDRFPVSTQVAFTTAILDCLQRCNYCKLVPVEPVNITSFECSAEPDSNIHFDLVYHGDAIEFRLQSISQKWLCEKIIAACHRVANFRNITQLGFAYNFAKICVHDTPSRSPLFCSRSHQQHNIPHEDLCKDCQRNEKVADQFQMWKDVISKDNIPDMRRIKDDHLTLQDMTFLAEKLGKLEKTQLHPLAEELELKVSDETFEGLEGWRLVLSFLLEWEKKCESKKRSAQELARIFNSVRDRTPAGDNLRNLYMKLARKLDFRVAGMQ